MNRLVFFLGFLGVVATGYTPVVLYANQDGQAPDAEMAASRPATAVPVAAQTPSSASGETVVGTPPKVPAVSPSKDFAVKGSATEAKGNAIKAEPIYSDALPALYEGEYDVPIWAMVTRGANLHTAPNVSSPTTWLYAVGSKLTVVGYRQGWYQVVDPESSRSGFIYANYYLEAMRGPNANPAVPVAAKAPVRAPTRTALAQPAPAVTARPSRFSQSSLSRLGPPEQRVAPPTRPMFAGRRSFGSNRDSVESLFDRAMHR